MCVCVCVCVARNTSLPLPQVSTPPVEIFRNTDLRVLHALLISVLIFACQIPGNHSHSATRYSSLARDIADPRRHETPDYEFRISQLVYQKGNQYGNVEIRNLYGNASYWYKS